MSQRDQYWEITTDGDSIDSFVENTNWGTTSDMWGINDGVLLAGSLNGEPAFAKMDTNYNIEWSTSLGFQYGEAAAVFADGSDYYVSGIGGFNMDFIAKFDASGDTSWMITLQQSTFTKLSDIIKLSDGNYLASGNLDDYPIAVKFNSTGDTIWTYYEPLFISFQKMNAYEKSNGNIVLLAERSMIELDQNGNKLSDTMFTINAFYDMHFANDTFYLFGYDRNEQWGNEKQPLVELRNSDWDSLGSWTYNSFMHPLADNVLSDAVKTPGGGFLAAGKLRDSINVTNNTYNIFAVKFNDGVIIDATINDTTDTITAVLPIGASIQLSVYPNPTSNSLWVRSNQSIEGVSIFDLQGRIIYQWKTEALVEEINVSMMEPGYYILKLENGASRKFIIE